MLAAMLLALLTTPPPHAHHPPKAAGLAVTILYDAFTDRPDLRPDWGFSALIEYHGKRILFDTGDNATILAENARRLHVDLRHLDLIVISHRHSDHTAGLPFVLGQAPATPLYAPREPFSVFGGVLPTSFLRSDSSLPVAMRYFGGRPPDSLETGTLWPATHITLVDSTLEIAPGIQLVTTVSRAPGTLELRELSLVLHTPQGLVVVVGCSHPGIENILAATGRLDPHVHAIIGGLHLVTTPDSAIVSLVRRLHDQWHLDRVAPGHCTGEPAFAAFRTAFGTDDLYAGLGTRLVDP